MAKRKRQRSNVPDAEWAFQKYSKSIGPMNLGQYMAVPMIFFQMFEKRDDAILLAYLWNKRQAYERHGKLSSTGWFFCTVSQIRKGLGMNPHAQARSLKRMEVLGLVQRKLGKPSEDYPGLGRDVRYVRVNRQQVFEMAKLVATSKENCAAFKQYVLKSTQFSHPSRYQMEHI